MLNCKVSVSILLAAFRNAIACFPKHPNPPLPPPHPPEKASEERAQKFYKKKPKRQNSIDIHVYRGPITGSKGKFGLRGCITRNLRNDDGDGKENGRKSSGFRLAKQQRCTCNTFFLYISLPPLHYYNAKTPNSTFYRGREHNLKQRLSFSFPEI